MQMPLTLTTRRSGRGRYIRAIINWLRKSCVLWFTITARRLSELLLAELSCIGFWDWDPHLRWRWLLVGTTLMPLRIWSNVSAASSSVKAGPLKYGLYAVSEILPSYIGLWEWDLYSCSWTIQIRICCITSANFSSVKADLFKSVAMLEILPPCTGSWDQDPALYPLWRLGGSGTMPVCICRNTSAAFSSVKAGSLKFEP